MNLQHAKNSKKFEKILSSFNKNISSEAKIEKISQKVPRKSLQIERIPEKLEKTAKNSKKISQKKRLKNYSNDDSTDTSNFTPEMTNTTNLLKNKLIESLKNFKTVSSEAIIKKKEFEEEIFRFKNDFTYLKSEISEVLHEKNKSNEEISRVKDVLASPRNRSEEISENWKKNEKFSENVTMNIMQLNAEIKEMKKRLEVAEQKLREKEVTNESKPTQYYEFEGTLLEKTGKNVNCQACSIF